MSRTINSGLLAALTANSVEPFYAVELLFDVKTSVGVDGEVINLGPMRMWTGLGNRTINVRGANQVFAGTGALLNIAAAEEVGDLSAKAMTLSLTGLDSSIISLALQEPYQRRKARVYMGEKSVSSVVEIFSGQMDTMQITDEPDASTVVMTIESKLVELERSRNWRYTDESHKSRHSGDTFLSYVQSIQDQQVAWGRATG
tara:strand:+ start:12987 stop:13589 length:603 start_codon:yes stop_codon:yes gene_type:complete